MNYPSLEEQNKAIREECQALADFMVAKNTAYGGQALAPLKLLSKGNPLDIIFARIEDKLSRITRGHNAGEDPWTDLRGYITLWKVYDRLKERGYYNDSGSLDDGILGGIPVDIARLVQSQPDAQAVSAQVINDPLGVPIEDVKSLDPCIPKDVSFELSEDSDVLDILIRPLDK